METIRRMGSRGRKKKKIEENDSEQSECSVISMDLNSSTGSVDNVVSGDHNTDKINRPARKKKHSKEFEEKIHRQLEEIKGVFQSQELLQRDQLDILKRQEQFLEEQTLLREKKHRISLEKESEPVDIGVPPLIEHAESPAGETQLEKYSRDVRRAFQVATSQLILLLLLVLGYYTVAMINDYLAPFFWAVLLSIILRKPKKVLMQLANPMRKIESESLGYFGTMKAKFFYLISHFNRTYFFGLLGGAVFGKMCCLTVGWGCWVPWVSLTVGIIVCITLVIAVASISKSSSLEGFFTTVLVLGFLVLLVLFVFTFGYKAMTETSDFAYKIQTIVEEKIRDPKWAVMMEDYGITKDSFSDAVATGREHLDTWATEQGYNITEIEETIIVYGAMLAGNETEVVEVVVIANDTAVATTSYMDYVPNINFDELQEYYNSVIEIVDFEAVGNVASSVGGFVFGTGSGVLGMFSSILSSLLGAVDVLLQFIVFIGALFYFMESEESIVCMAVKIVPISKRQQTFLSETIHQNIIQVFVTSALLSLSHGFATLIYFSIFDLDFAYSSAFIVGAMALFPLTSPWLIYAPTLAIAYLNGNDYTLYIAIGLFLLQQAVGFIDERIYAMIPGSSPYLTGIGLAVGVSTYGVQGILIGPMLIVTTKTLFDIFCANISQPDVESKE